MADEIVEGSTASTDTQAISTDTNVTSEAIVEGGKQPAQPTSQEVTDWANDQRYDRMWKKNPNGLYKSYTELEKVYNPLKEKSATLEKQVSDLTGIFKEQGIDPTPEQIKSVLDELKGLKDPNSLLNKRNTFLSHWLDDEARFTRYGKKIDDFFTGLTEQELLDDHPGLTREQALNQAKIEAQLKQQEEQLKAIQNEKDTQVAIEKLNKGLDAAKQYAEKVGFTWSDDIRKSLIKSCIDNGIPTSLVFEHFLRINGEAIEKSFADKIKQEQLKSLNKNKGSVVPSAGGKSAAVNNAKTSFKDQMLSALRGGQQT